jgi:hypothetical protein
MEPVARLALPMAIASAAGAAVVASMTRWWMLGPYHGVVAMLVAAAAGGWLGAMITYSLRADPIRTTVRKGTLGAAILGPLCALSISLVCDPGELAASAVLLGVCVAGALLPCVTAALFLAHRSSRSRPSSLVGGADRRAAWRATAVWLAAIACIGMVPARIDGTGQDFWAETFWWTAREKAELAVAPVIVVLCACAIVVVVAALDIHAEWLVSRARRGSEGWRVDPSGATTAMLDVGIGHDAWIEHVTGRVTYRENAVERVVAIGDIETGSDLLMRATNRSAIALFFVGAAMLLTLMTFATLQRG